MDSNECHLHCKCARITAISARTPVSMLANGAACINVPAYLYVHKLVIIYTFTYTFGTHTWTRMSAQQEIYLRNTSSQQGVKDLPH